MTITGDRIAGDRVTGQGPALKRLGRLVLAVLLPAGAVALSVAVAAASSGSASLLPSVAAVVLVASFAGFVPGLIATAIALVLQATFTMAPLVDDPNASGDRLRLILFALTGILASGLAWLRSRAEARAERIATDATRVRDRADLAARRLEALQALSTELLDAGTPERIIAVLLHQAARALRADEVVMWTVDRTRGELVVRASLQGSVVDAVVGAALPLDAGWPAAESARESRAVFTENVDELASLPPGLAAAVSAAAVPMTLDGETPGVLGITWARPNPLPSDRRLFILALARFGAAALDRTRLLAAEVDARQHAEQRAAELEAVLGAVEDGFVLTETDGRIRSANEAAMRLLGGSFTTLDELLARMADSGGAVPRLEAGTPLEARRPSEPGTWLELTRYEVRAPDGEDLPSSVVVVRDVTAFRRVRALQDAFFGLLSHELRTPVTTIYAGAALLARRDRRLDPDAAEEVLADMASEADRLYRLVEDLMVLARFDASFALSGQPVLLQHIVTDIVGQERGRWPAVRIIGRIDTSVPPVVGDETAISQVIRNLISNAAKYSPAGGQVVLDMAVPEGLDRVELDVRDDGPGVAPAETERVFDPFYRSPLTAKLAGGAGIGLYVSRRLAEAMGGTLRALPVEGPERGGHFRLSLPVYAGVDADEFLEEPMPSQA